MLENIFAFIIILIICVIKFRINYIEDVLIRECQSPIYAKYVLLINIKAYLYLLPTLIKINKCIY